MKFRAHQTWGWVAQEHPGFEVKGDSLKMNYSQKELKYDSEFSEALMLAQHNQGLIISLSTWKKKRKGSLWEKDNIIARPQSVSVIFGDVWLISGEKELVTVTEKNHKKQYATETDSQVWSLNNYELC